MALRDELISHSILLTSVNVKFYLWGYGWQKMSPCFTVCSNIDGSRSYSEATGILERHCIRQNHQNQQNCNTCSVRTSSAEWNIRRPSSLQESGWFTNLINSALMILTLLVWLKLRRIFIFSLLCALPCNNFSTTWTFRHLQLSINMFTYVLH